MRFIGWSPMRWLNGLVCMDEGLGLLVNAELKEVKLSLLAMLNEQFL